MFQQLQQSGPTGAAESGPVLNKSEKWQESQEGALQCLCSAITISISLTKAATSGFTTGSARTRVSINGVDGANFAVWAPDAESVYVMGAFNGWNKDSHPMQPRGFVRNLGSASFRRSSRAMRTSTMWYLVTTDIRSTKPIRSHFTPETPPRTASIVWDLGLRMARSRVDGVARTAQLAPCSDVDL